MNEKNCRQIRLLTWISFIGQFVNPVGRKVMGYMGWMGGIVILDRKKFNFNREHENSVATSK